jgi:hypothetical protein
MIPEIENQSINPVGISNGINNVRPVSVIQPYVGQIGDTRIWMINQPYTGYMPVPVTVRIGTPVVNMPGCVKAHKENAKNPASRNKSLVNDDPKQNVVLCDGGMPYFEPPDYQANRLDWRTIYGEAPVVDSGIDVGDPPVAPTPETPEPPSTPTDTKEDPPCPGPMAPRIGDVAQNQKEKVSGFELQRDPKNPDGVKICVTLYEDIGPVEAFLPAPQLVTTTAVIATVATGSALLAKPLADLLLKVVKPVVKKAIGTIQKKLGKTPYRPTQSELRTNRYREKKGMLGINFAKQHSQAEKKLKESQKKEEEKLQGKEV